MHLHSERVLPFELAAARVAGSVADVARRKGRSTGFADVAIAAIAKAHGLTAITRNLKHFVVFGIPAHDPFRSLPE